MFKALPAIFLNCAIEWNPGTKYKPWLLSGSNLHNHQKSTFAPAGSWHGQQFSQLAPLKKIMAPSMDPVCQVEAFCTTMKHQYWGQQVQGMASNFPKLHHWRKSRHQVWTLAAKWQQFAQPLKISIGSNRLKAWPALFLNCTLEENPGTKHGPWLPSGSNLHIHNKSTLESNGAKHGQ